MVRDNNYCGAGVAYDCSLGGVCVCVPVHACVCVCVCVCVNNKWTTFSLEVASV